MPDQLEHKKDYSKDKRDEMAKDGRSLADGSFPINDRGDLEDAISAYGRTKDSKKPQVRRHIRKHAKRLGMTHKLDKLKEEKAASGPPQFVKDKNKSGKGRPSDDKGGTADTGINNIGDLAKKIKTYKTAKADAKPDLWKEIQAAAKKLKATNMLSGLDAPPDQEKALMEAAWLESKVASPDPNAVKLREYWAHGKGRAKWSPGVPGDFNRLVRHLRKYVHNPHMLKGLAANIHHLALGAWPGREHAKSALDWIDDGCPLEAKEIEHGDEYLELKLARDELEKLLSGADEEDDDESLEDPAEEATETPDQEATEGDAEAALTEEEATEQALADDVHWDLQPDGTLDQGDDESAEDPAEEATETPEEEAAEGDDDGGELDSLFDLIRRRPGASA
jgi:hypothetical protein